MSAKLSVDAAFAIEHMEPMRPVVDRVGSELVSAETFTGADFSILPDGVRRLNSELARRVAQMAMECTSSIDRELLGLKSKRKHVNSRR